MRSSSAYRALVHLYPRSFRDDFGDDMVALFEEQRADEAGARVWGRALADLAVSVPVQHLEAIVHRRPQRFVSSAIALLGVVLLVVGVSIGSAVSPLLLMIGVGVCTTAVVAMQQQRDVVAPSVVGSWWKVLLAGAAVIVTVIVVRGVWPPSMEPDEDLAWALTFGGIVLAITLMTIGVMLGALQLVSRLQASRRTTAP